MSGFSIQYIYEIIDKYSPAIKKIKDNTKGFKKSMKSAALSVKKLSKRLKDMGKKMKSVGKGMMLKMTLPILTAFGFITREVIAAEETFNKFATVFQDVSTQAETAFKVLRKEYGLSSKQSKMLLSDTGDMLTGFGFAGKEALDLSFQVQKLAVDLASFTNFSGGVIGASAALTKGLLGERESMKSLGIAIDESLVKEQLLRMGKAKLTGMALKQAKAAATLVIAQRQSKNAIGDYERTSTSAANQVRLFSARLQDFALTFKEDILPFITKAVTKLNNLVESFSKMSPVGRRAVLIIGALLAVAGPVVFIVGQLTIAMGALTAASLPVIGTTLLIIAAIVAVIVIIIKWKDIVYVLRDIWGKLVNFFQNIIVPALVKSAQAIFSPFIMGFNAVKKGMELIKNSKLGSASSKIGEFFGNIKNKFSGNVDINVNAPRGAVKSISSQSSSNNFRLGTNMGM